MFLSRREGVRRAGGQASSGPVTVPGRAVGAYLEGERREMAVYAPGGYFWVPALGDEVLVLKAGAEGEKPCVVGRAMGEVELGAGEVLISTGKAALRLSPGGGVAVTGVFSVNGTVVGPTPPPEEKPEEGSEGSEDGSGEGTGEGTEDGSGAASESGSESGEEEV